MYTRDMGALRVRITRASSKASGMCARQQWASRWEAPVVNSGTKTPAICLTRGHRWSACTDNVCSGIAAEHAPGTLGYPRTFGIGAQRTAGLCEWEQNVNQLTDDPDRYPYESLLAQLVGGYAVGGSDTDEDMARRVGRGCRSEALLAGLPRQGSANALTIWAAAACTSEVDPASRR